MELQANGRLHYDDDLMIAINHVWSTENYVGMEGWVIGKKHPIKKIELTVAGVSTEITNFTPVPQLADLCQQFGASVNCGFFAMFPRQSVHELQISAETAGGALQKIARVAGAVPTADPQFTVGDRLFKDFMNEVNEKQLDVIEIGSRVVSPGSQSKRELFPGASEYVGFDYYPDDNTQVVGDAHKLSAYFGGRQFGAVFSLSVLEHIAMPWVVAVEINKVMRIGGITFHLVPTAFPIHARPWDFWRCTEEAMRILFSRPLGFEVLKTGYVTPVRVYPDSASDAQHARLPFSPTFGAVVVLARKTAEVDSSRFRWEMTVHQALGAGSHYPLPEQTP